jgi:putative protein-disulfide isomerase
MLIYIADPMCSWCYGFGPQLQALLDRFAEQPLRLVMGGLRPYTTQPLDPPQRRAIAQHWDHVRRASGLPFDPSLLMREGFVYDTEPACRAVVAVRGAAATLAWPLFKAIQHAFYAQARDVTQTDLLAAVYAETRAAHGNTPSMSVDEFAAALQGDAARAATRTDFALAREWEVQGFPTLFAERDGHYALLASGYTKAADLIDRARPFFDART